MKKVKKKIVIGRLDVADWLIKEGYGTPYKVRVGEYATISEHFTIPCLGKSIMAIRITYHAKLVDMDDHDDLATWGESYTHKRSGREERIFYLCKHSIDLEYLCETGWVEFVKFDTRALKKDTLENMIDQERAVNEIKNKQQLEKFEEKIRSLLDHMITFHGLTLV